MKKISILGLVGLGLAACGDNVESPIELVKTTTIRDTYEYCMKVNGNRKYCKCEISDLERNFPWFDYITVVDILAKEDGHIAKVIEKYKGNRQKILEELNCDTCYFAVALGAINISPSPRCVEMLAEEMAK